MSQEIKNISLKDLVLWTENPRDPMDPNASDQEIANRAISADGRSNWSLKKLFEKMGQRFDQSEIPTVAYIDNKPIVYDGNRRILIGKIIHGHATVASSGLNFSKFDFPESIPCNVCDKKTALEHVDRKHADSGSWKPLERDIFKHKHMGKEKSPFLIIEEATNLISKNPKLNQRFVKEEIFDPTPLRKLGFSTNDNTFKHNYQEQEDADKLLSQILGLVKNKEITTRKNRGKIIDLIGSDILKKQVNDFRPYSAPQSSTRKTPTTKAKYHQLFGAKLKLKAGTVNNLYSDLLKLFSVKDSYSGDFPMIIRMGLRLITEIAASDMNITMPAYINKNYPSANEKLSKDEKTTLSTQLVKKETFIKLLQVGAHAYTATNNIDQTVAMSLILGKILEISHGK